MRNQLPPEELTRLSNLELEVYATGSNEHIGLADLVLMEQLNQTRVAIHTNQVQGSCADILHKIGVTNGGIYPSFIQARQAIVASLVAHLQPPAWNMLSVVYDGIYVGDPEDMYEYRKAPISGSFTPAYQVVGFGIRLGEVIFLDHEAPEEPGKK